MLLRPPQRSAAVIIASPWHLTPCEHRRVRGEKVRLGARLDVRRARTLIIQDVWTGYSGLAPIAAIYELHRTRSGGLTGEGVLSTALSKPKRVPISMKASTVASFLEALAHVSLVEGTYEPHQDHTDDYPRIEIVVQVPPRDFGERGGIALLYTESQGDFHTPWAVYVGGKEYIATEDAIGQALRALDRPLKRSVLRAMTR